MTLEKWMKEVYKGRWPTAFPYECPKNVDALYVDFMQRVKQGYLPVHIQTQKQAVDYFFNSIVRYFDKRTQVVVLCLDKRSPPVKEMICHSKRYDLRCAECKKTNKEMLKGVRMGPECFSPACERDCLNHQVLWSAYGPYMNEDESAPISFDWKLFSLDTQNLKKELYPRIANRLLSWRPPAGQMLFVNGLPFKTKEVYEYSGDVFTYQAHPQKDKRVILDYWSYGDLPLSLENEDELFGETYFFDPEGGRRNCPEMKNDIMEGDSSIFFYAQFFPHLKTHMFHINDGDAIPIGLLRALEEFRGTEPDHSLWLWIPLKEGEEKRMVKMSDYYVNLTELCDKIEHSHEFVSAGYQSPVATMVFLTILSGTDFFEGEFCSGIRRQPQEWSDDPEKRAKQSPGVIDLFFENLGMFSHLVQYYTTVKSLSDRRRMVLDEELFSIFTQMCYISAHKAGAAKKRKKPEEEVDYEDIRIHCKSRKRPQERAPEEMVIKRWGRQITWNGDYWANGFRNIYVDPFEEYEARPVYGYKLNQGITNDVSFKVPPLDEVYKRNFWKRRQKEAEVLPISEERKRNAMEVIRGK